MREWILEVNPEGLEREMTLFACFIVDPELGVENFYEKEGATD